MGTETETRARLASEPTPETLTPGQEVRRRIEQALAEQHDIISRLSDRLEADLRPMAVGERVDGPTPDAVTSASVGWLHDQLDKVFAENARLIELVDRIDT